MRKTWMPVTAGALDIACSIFAGMMAAATLSCVLNIAGYADAQTLIIFAVLFAVVCLAFAGGVSAMLRKRWRLALAGSVAALFNPLWILGVAAIILTVLSKNEFE